MENSKIKSTGIFLGYVSGIYNVIQFLWKFIRTAGDIDFVITRSDDLAWIETVYIWIKSMLNYLINKDLLFNIIFIFVAVGWIYFVKKYPFKSKKPDDAIQNKIESINFDNKRGVFNTHPHIQSDSIIKKKAPPIEIKFDPKECLFKEEGWFVYRIQLINWSKSTFEFVSAQIIKIYDEDTGVEIPNIHEKFYLNLRFSINNPTTKRMKPKQRELVNICYYKENDKGKDIHICLKNGFLINGNYRHIIEVKASWDSSEDKIFEKFRIILQTNKDGYKVPYMEKVN